MVRQCSEYVISESIGEKDLGYKIFYAQSERHVTIITRRICTEVLFGECFVGWNGCFFPKFFVRTLTQSVFHTSSTPRRRGHALMHLLRYRATDATSLVSESYIKAYEKAIKNKNGLSNVFFNKDPEICDILKVHDFEDPDEIPKPKYLISPVNVVVLDGLMATGALQYIHQQVIIIINQ
jgi:hypothetical protein